METTSRNVALIGSVVALLGAGAWKAWSCGGGDYEVAPDLRAYPERHAVKMLQDLLHESKAKKKEEPDDPRGLVQGIALTLQEDSKDKALANIDDALRRNRAEGYAANVANFLWDMRDLVSSGARESVPREEWTAYMQWRLNLFSEEKRGLPPRAPGTLDFPPGLDEGQKELERKKHAEALETERKAAVDSLRKPEDLAGVASPALAPHWLVARGGMAFRKGMLDEAEKSFRTVVEKYSQHPRAEVAAFMLMRIQVEQARRTVRALDANAFNARIKALEPAATAIKEFAKTYPKSRYTPELAGWRGALASLGGNPWQAIREYTVQFDAADHPEVLDAAAHEIERCLEAITNGEDGDVPAENWSTSTLPAEIAQRPLLAMRLVYFQLDGAASLDMGLWRYNFADTDGIRQMITRSRSKGLMEALAGAVSRQEHLYQEERWQPKFLSILAWAATESGAHAQAISLCEKSAKLLEASDDLQLVRATALERAGRFADAATAYGHLNETFPDSPLRAGLDVRLAETLRRSGHAGLALVALSEKDERVPVAKEDAGRLPQSLHNTYEINQRRNTLEWLAPLAELEADAVALRLKDANANIPYRNELRTRLLMHEEYAKAHALLDPASGNDTGNPEYSNEKDNGELDGHSSLTPRRWNKWVQPMVEANERLRHPKDAADQAQACWDMALAWEAADGLITTPMLDHIEAYTLKGDDTAAVLVTNGQAMGYPLDAINRELDAAPELSKTISYCLRAADLARGTPLGARALAKANDCLKRLTVSSPWLRQRATETHLTEVSRQLYDRLQRECPDSPDAKTAVWFTFTAPPKKPESAEEDAAANAPLNIVVANANPNGPFLEWHYDFWRKGILDQISNSAQDNSLETVRKTLQTIDTTFRPQYNSLDNAGLFNLLADLDALVSQPKIDPIAARRYIFHRLAGTLPDSTEGGMDAVADFIAYQKGVRAMSPGTQYSIATGPGGHHDPFFERDEIIWRGFLSQYPQSAKREAAQFQLARACVRHYIGLQQNEDNGQGDDDETQLVDIFCPVAAPHWFALCNAPLQGARALAALEEYEKTWPQGRYLADIHLLRGQFGLAAHDYPMALKNLGQTLDDPKHPELMEDAALAFSDCLNRLDDPDERAALIPALARDAASLHHFQLYIHRDFESQKLEPYEGFVDEMAKLLKGR